MANYQYRSRVNAWVCPHCSALVEDVQHHEETHQELVRVFTAWAEVIERPRGHGGAEGVLGDVPGIRGDSPGPVVDRVDPGPADPLDRALEATTFTTKRPADLVGES